MWSGISANDTDLSDMSNPEELDIFMKSGEKPTLDDTGAPAGVSGSLRKGV